MLLIFRTATESVFFRVRADSEETVDHLNIIEHKSRSLQCFDVNEISIMIDCKSVKILGILCGGYFV
jgi:hypothetical protein